MIARRLLALCCAVFVLAAPAKSIAAPLDKDVLAPINASLAAVNGNMPDVLNQYATDDVVVIDDFSPYIWRGKGAFGTWWHDVATMWKKIGLANGHAAGMDIKQYRVTSDGAYVAVPLVITYTINGKPGKQTGIWTFTLRKVDNTWKITTVSWGAISRE